MTSPLPELLLFAATFLFVVGRYYVPPIVLAIALRDTNPQERAEIVKEINVFFRRKRGRIDQGGDGKELPKQITETK